MIRGIDHIVILVNDLESATDDYTAMGFTVTPGGEHTDGATHNVLVSFADGAYLELIAFKQPAAQHRWWLHTRSGEGLIDFALWPDAIEADIAAMRAHGLEIEGPTAGGRTRPDGQRIEWMTGSPLTPDLPFLCADVTPRNLRVPDGPALQHANGVSGIAGITVAVKDLATSTQRYAALLGVPAPEPGIHSVNFTLGATTITLVQPAADVNNPVYDRLNRRGEGIYALALRADLTAEALDPARKHGARITFVP